MVTFSGASCVGSGTAVALAPFAVAKAPVDAVYLSSGEWQVEIAGKLYPASVSARPLYDPQMKRIHA